MRFIIATLLAAAALVSAAPLQEQQQQDAGPDSPDALLSGPPPPMWNIRCPREVQGACTPDDKLFFCTAQGTLYNQLSATCSDCRCSSSANGGRPTRKG